MMTPKNRTQHAVAGARARQHNDFVAIGKVKKKRSTHFQFKRNPQTVGSNAAMVRVFPANYREIVRVFPWRSKEWSVELYPDEQPFLFPSKGQAISFALAWADYHQPCEVRVFDGAGEMQRDIKVPDGNYRRVAAVDRRREQLEIDFSDRRNSERRS